MNDHTVAVVNGILIFTVVFQLVLVKIWTDQPGPSVIDWPKWESLFQSRVENQAFQMVDARNVRQEAAHVLVSDVVNDVSQEMSKTTTDEQLIAAITAAMKKEIEHKSSSKAGASNKSLSVNFG